MSSLKKPALIYVLVFTLSFLVFLIAGLPASFVWGFLKDKNVLPKGTEVTSVSGTVWNGEAKLNVRPMQIGKAALKWNMKPLKLFMAKLAVQVDAKADAGKLEGEWHWGVTSVGVSELAGNVSPQFVNQLAKEYRAKLDNGLSLHITELSMSHDLKQIHDANGNLSWAGGNISYVFSGRRGQANFPPLKGRLSKEGEEPRFVVTGPKQKQALIAKLDAEGWGKLEVLKHMADLSGQSWPGANKAKSDEVVFEVQQKFF